jgi:hypothetical protein
MPERRVYKRVPARLKVWCEGEDFTLLTESTNVSKHGFFVRASSPPASGTCFKATIQELGIVAQVAVRWARRTRDQGRAGMGLEVVTFELGAGALDAHIARARPPLAVEYPSGQTFDDAAIAADDDDGEHKPS